MKQKRKGILNSGTFIKYFRLCPASQAFETTELQKVDPLQSSGEEEKIYSVGSFGTATLKS
jgi:hypothetical protein